jgi:predicted dehydrogenase
MTSPAPLRFAVIGCGMLARSSHIPNLASSPKTTLQACCDLDPAALAICRDTYQVPQITSDYAAVIKDPDVDAICLATTEKLRLPVIELAAACNKPVYVEKPLARTLDEVRRIQAVVHASGIPFCVGHNRRSAPCMMAAHRLFRSHMENPRPCPWRFDRELEKRPSLPEDGIAGMSVRINDDWYSWKAWVFDKNQAPHGPMLFEMTHFTDMCNWFLAAEPEEVVALESGMLNHGIVIRYKTGEMATLSMSANGTFGYPKELYEMFGQGGAVIVDHMVEIRTAGLEGVPDRLTFPLKGDRFPEIGTELGLSGWLAKRRANCAQAAAEGNTSLVLGAEPDRGHAHALDRFVDEIRGTGPRVCGVDDAVLATRVAFAAIRSAAEHRVVNLKEI